MEAVLGTPHTVCFNMVSKVDRIQTGLLVTIKAVMESPERS